MEQSSLLALLESDREMIMGNLARDRAPSAAQAVLEKAVDRVMYRYVEQCADPLLGDAAQAMLQSVRSAIPMIDAVSEARAWQKTLDTTGERAKRMPPAALGLLSAGVVLVVASVLAMLIGGGFGGALSFVKAILPVALGLGAVFWAGLLAGRPKKKRLAVQTAADVRTEFLVDAEKAYHCLRGAMVVADHRLETLRQEADARLKNVQGAAGEASGDEINLFAELMESAYAAGNDTSREMASAIRFYLHGRGIDAVDCAPGRESWFEFLPAPSAGTLRPALVREGRLLKKGLASRG